MLTGAEGPSRGLEGSHRGSDTDRILVPQVDDTVHLRDGRAIAYAEWGRADGPPVLFVHGTPYSRIWCPNVETTESLGVRLISVDRPGFGRSDVDPNLTIGGWPDDVVQLADALGIERFAIVGWSGGGMYAAGCAAKIPDRLIAVGVVAGAIGPVYEQPEGFERLDEEERRIFELARKDREAAAKLSADVPWLRDLPERPESLLEDYEIPDGDRWFHEDPERMAAILEAAREAVRQGPWGAAWDYVAYLTPWGFALEDISIEFHIWHGAQDTIMAAEDVEFWASRIPRSIVTVWPDAGHMVVSKHWEEILRMLVALT